MWCADYHTVAERDRMSTFVGEMACILHTLYRSMHSDKRIDHRISPPSVLIPKTLPESASATMILRKPNSSSSLSLRLLRGNFCVAINVRITSLQCSNVRYAHTTTTHTTNE